MTKKAKQNISRGIKASWARRKELNAATSSYVYRDRLPLLTNRKISSVNVVATFDNYIIIKVS